MTTENTYDGKPPKSWCHGYDPDLPQMTQDVRDFMKQFVVTKYLPKGRIELLSTSADENGNDFKEMWLKKHV